MGGVVRQPAGGDCVWGERSAGPEERAQEEGGGGRGHGRETRSGTSPPQAPWRRASPSLSVCWADCRERPGESRSETIHRVLAAASLPCSHSRPPASQDLGSCDSFPPARCYPPRPRNLSCCCRKRRNSSKGPSPRPPWRLRATTVRSAGSRKLLQGPPHGWLRPKYCGRAQTLRPLTAAPGCCRWSPNWGWRRGEHLAEQGCFRLLPEDT